MKKLMFLCMFLLATLAVKAQFEQGKWFVNPALTGLDLSYSENTKTHFGIEAKGGAFVVDNFALLVNLGAEFMDDDSLLSAGVGGRYYFNKTGIYLGGGFDVIKYDIKYPTYDYDKTHFRLNSEVGYAFFITRSVTIEPGVYYTWDSKDNDFSTVGFKIGFGIYF